MKLISYIICFVFAFNLYSQSIDIELLKKADNYFIKKDYYDAKKIYENLIQSPNIKEQDRVIFNLGKCYYALQQKEKSYITLKTLLLEYPDSKYIPPAIPIIISYLKSKRKYVEAIELLEKYEKRYPSNSLKRELLEIYEASENYTKALTYLENNFVFSQWYVEKKVKYLRYLQRITDAINFLNTAIKKFRNSRYYKMLAELYIENGDFSTAENCYEKAYEISNNINYLIEIGRMYAIHNKVNKAVNTWNRLFKILGRKRFTYEQVANLYKEYGLYNELLKLYNDAKKNGLDFTREKINILEIMGKYKDAVIELIKILDSKNFLYVKERFIKLAIIEDEFNTVENVLKQNIEKSDKFLKEKLIQILYQIYYEADKIEDAEKLLLKYVKLDNIDVCFINNFIDHFLSKGEYNRLYRIFQKVKDKNRLSGIILFKYAKLLYYLEKYDMALAVINKIKKDKFHIDQVNYLKALIYFKIGKYKNTIKILKNYRNNFDYFTMLLDALAYSGKIEEALKYIDKEINNKNFKKDILYYKEAIFLLFLTKTGEAKSYFKKLIEIYPNSEYANEAILFLFIWDNEFIRNNKEREMAFHNFIKSYYLKKYRQATKFLEKISIANTTLEEIIIYLSARCYFLAEDYDSALNLLLPLIKKESMVLPYALELTGNIYYFKKKDKNKALKIYKRIIDKYPNHPEIQEIRNRIIKAES